MLSLPPSVRVFLATCTAAILTIVASGIAHDINPRAYLHCATKPILGGWPQSRLRDLLPDRILGLHPGLYVGDLDALPGAVDAPALPDHGWAQKPSIDVHGLASRPSSRSRFLRLRVELINAPARS